MFRLAERSLLQNPKLKKVVIMEHPPRFDEPMVDPTSLKPALARLANATLGNLWLNSKLKDKIVIGLHSLECTDGGDAYNARYRNNASGKSDGVHFWGPSGCKEFTNSLKSILMLALSQQNRAQCGIPQGEKQVPFTQQKNQNKRKYSPSVSTKNRFNVFNSNSGNY